jgi:hypothetical protein
MGVGRRRLLQLLAVASSSSLVGCVESGTSGSGPVEETQSLPEGAVRDGGSTWSVGPTDPGCPEYDAEGNITGYRWGMGDIEEDDIDTVLDSRAAAYRWADDGDSSPELITGVETLRWRNSEIQIAQEYEAETWFLVRFHQTNHMLLIPRENSTDVIRFWYGDC